MAQSYGPNKSKPPRGRGRSRRYDAHDDRDVDGDWDTNRYQPPRSSYRQNRPGDSQNMREEWSSPSISSSAVGGNNENTASSRDAASALTRGSRHRDDSGGGGTSSEKKKARHRRPEIQVYVPRGRRQLEASASSSLGDPPDENSPARRGGNNSPQRQTEETTTRPGSAATSRGRRVRAGAEPYVPRARRMQYHMSAADNENNENMCKQLLLNQGGSICNNNNDISEAPSADGKGLCQYEDDQFMDDIDTAPQHSGKNSKQHLTGQADVSVVEDFELPLQRKRKKSDPANEKSSETSISSLEVESRPLDHSTGENRNIVDSSSVVSATASSDVLADISSAKDITPPGSQIDTSTNCDAFSCTHDPRSNASSGSCSGSSEDVCSETQCAASVNTSSEQQIVNCPPDPGTGDTANCAFTSEIAGSDASNATVLSGKTMSMEAKSDISGSKESSDDEAAWEMAPDSFQAPNESVSKSKAEDELMETAQDPGVEKDEVESISPMLHDDCSKDLELEGPSVTNKESDEKSDPIDCADVGDTGQSSLLEANIEDVSNCPDGVLSSGVSADADPRDTEEKLIDKSNAQLVSQNMVLDGVSEDLLGQTGSQSDVILENAKVKEATSVGCSEMEVDAHCDSIATGSDAHKTVMVVPPADQASQIQDSGISKESMTSDTGAIAIDDVVQDEMHVTGEIDSEGSAQTMSSGEQKSVIDRMTDDAGSTNQDGEDTWDSLFDDSGECLDANLMDELTRAVGAVKVEKPTHDYSQYSPKDFDGDDEAYNHLVELYDFPSELLTRDLIAIFRDFTSRGFDIKWVDDTHAIGVFSSNISAQEALTLKHPLVKVRPISEATRQTKLKARRSAEFMLPYKPRPETNASCARRLVTGALGLNTRVSKEQREQERKQLKDAREKKRLAAKQKQDAWDGTISKCAMDEV